MVPMVTYQLPFSDSYFQRVFCSSREHLYSIQQFLMSHFKCTVIHELSYDPPDRKVDPPILSFSVLTQLQDTDEGDMAFTSIDVVLSLLENVFKALCNAALVDPEGSRLSFLFPFDSSSFIRCFFRILLWLNLTE